MKNDKIGISELRNLLIDCHKIRQGWFCWRYHPARQNSLWSLSGVSRQICKILISRGF